MYADNSGRVPTSTDLTKHLACLHHTTLDVLATGGETTPPPQVNEAIEVIFRLGLDNEKACLQRLSDNGPKVVEIPSALP